MKKIIFTLLLFSISICFAQGHTSIPVYDHIKGIRGEPMGVYSWENPEISQLRTDFNFQYANYNFYWNELKEWKVLAVGNQETDYLRFCGITSFDIGLTRWLALSLRIPYVVQMSRDAYEGFKREGDFGDVLIQSRFEPFTNSDLPFRSNFGLALKLPSGTNPVDGNGDNTGTGSTDWVFRTNNTVRTWKLLFFFGGAYTVTGKIDQPTGRIDYGNITDLSLGFSIQPIEYLTFAFKFDGYYRGPSSVRLTFSNDWALRWNDSYRLTIIPEVYVHLPRSPVSFAIATAIDLQGERSLGSIGLLVKMNIDGNLWTRKVDSSNP